MGCTGSAVAVINMAASLESQIGELVLLESDRRTHHYNTSEDRDYSVLHDWIVNDEPLPDALLRGSGSFQRLRAFGIDKAFYSFTRAMLWAFISGGFMIFVSFVYWVALTQVLAGIVMMALVVAVALGLTLLFLM